MSNIHTLSSLNNNNSSTTITYPSHFEKMDEESRNTVNSIRGTLLKSPKVKEELKRRLKLREGCNYNTLSELLDKISTDQVIDEMTMSMMAKTIGNQKEEISLLKSELIKLVGPSEVDKIYLKYCMKSKNNDEAELSRWREIQKQLEKLSK